MIVVIDFYIHAYIHTYMHTYIYTFAVSMFPAAWRDLHPAFKDLNPDWMTWKDDLEATSQGAKTNHLGPAFSDEQFAVSQEPLLRKCTYFGSLHYLKLLFDT